MRFTFLILLCFFNIYPQEIEKDSVLHKLKLHTQEDTVKSRLLTEASYHILHKNPKKSMEYADKSIRIARQEQWKFGLAAALRQKGNVYYTMGNNLKALDYFLEALKISEETNQKSLTLNLYNNLGNIYADINDYQKSLKNYRSFLNAAIRTNDTINIIRGYNNIGNVKNETKDMDSAIVYFNNALKLSTHIKNELFQAAIINNLGISYKYKKEYDIALNYYFKATQIAKKINNKYIETSALNSIAKVNLLLNSFDNAEAYADSALNMAEHINAIEWQSDSWDILSKVYEHQDKDKLALLAFKNYIKLHDSVVNEEKKAELTKKDMQYQLEKQDALAKAIIKKQTFVKNTAIGIGIMLLLFSVIGYTLYKRKRDEQQLKEIANFKASIAEIELKALRSQMNPHFIFNSLNSISDYLDNNDISKADEYLTKFSKLTRAILENSEKKWITLKEDLKLLEMYIEIESLRLRNNLNYSFNIDNKIDAENTLIPPLILQPLIENSIWHGISKNNKDGYISIHIKKENSHLICSVEDNGTGRNEADKKKTSMGLAITRQRIEIINKIKNVEANINFIDKPEGLIVELLLPLELKF